MPNNTRKDYTGDKANQGSKSPSKSEDNVIDTDNDGKYRTKGDTRDQGDPRSPYGKKNPTSGTDEDVEEDEA